MKAWGTGMLEGLMEALELDPNVLARLSMRDRIAVLSKQRESALRKYVASHANVEGAETMPFAQVVVFLQRWILRVANLTQQRATTAPATLR